jgi:hypothetical protein
MKKRIISTERAQEICRHWYNGQWSAYYQFLSSGVFLIENTLQYLRETEDNLHPEYALFPGTLTQREERELNSLKNYFIARAAAAGIGVEYHKHTLYGYLIPYITEETPDSIADNVKCLAYLK